MMNKPRPKIDADLPANIALEALRGHATVAGLAARYEISRKHPGKAAFPGCLR